MLEYGTDKIERFLEERRGFYGTILVCRPHNMRTFMDVVRRRPDLIEGVTGHLRCRSVLRGARDPRSDSSWADPPEQTKIEAMLVEEASLAGAAHLVLSVSAREARSFAALVSTMWSCWGTFSIRRPARSLLRTRSGLLFVGRLKEDGSPNVDGLSWFIRDILPRVQEALGHDVRLTVAGANGAPSMSGLNGSSVNMLGQVKDLSPVYDTSRVFIAPMRFAAGIPLKVHEAAAHGVPLWLLRCSPSSWAGATRRIFWWRTTPGEFAAQCARLYQDEALWTRLRMNALDRVRDDCDPVRFRKTIARIVDAIRPRDSEVMVPPASRTVDVKSDCRKQDFRLIKQDPDFDSEFFLEPSAPRLSRDKAIENFINSWNADISRKPYSGFNPRIYAEQAMPPRELRREIRSRISSKRVSREDPGSFRL